MTTAKLCVPLGARVQLTAGEMSSPRQVYREGIGRPWRNASDTTEILLSCSGDGSCMAQPASITRRRTITDIPLFLEIILSLPT